MSACYYKQYNHFIPLLSLQSAKSIFPLHKLLLSPPKKIFFYTGYVPGLKRDQVIAQFAECWLIDLL